jgi:hypothetical protein
MVARRRLATLAGAAGAVALAVVIAIRGPELYASLAACSAAAIAAAIAIHAATLACRCEAWRIAVGSIDGRRLGRLVAHTAGGVGSAAGMLQGAGTAPVRAAAVRRLAPNASPPAKQLVVAEVPVFLIEAALIAVVCAIAVRAMPQAPGWAVPAACAGTAAALVALRVVARRTRDRSAAAGLRVLGDRDRRASVLALLVAVTALGVARAWLILLGFGLPHDLAGASFAFISLGVFGLLPIGPGSTPVAMLAVAGAADPTLAIAAGLAVTATSWAGVGVYALVGATLWAGRAASRSLATRSASSVDQPKWRAASPSPSSGL